MAVYVPMRCSDKSGAVIITALDRRAFAAAANLASSLAKVYQQSFIPFECLS
ncbi:hypothetical protein [Pseudomonas sp. A34-9]|uniref:hypothetical protein n=1 Tax=Pseudomonas sp. A34-9 TaxID=3034675 RepID=UPI00240E2949|nr:hypothetical protein [Pseudomonas sp. A34-9]